MKPIIIIGAGGHALVLADALLASGRQLLGFTSDAPSLSAEVIHGLRLIGTDDMLNNYLSSEIDLVNGLGGIDCVGLRRCVQQRLESKGWNFSGVRHPAAIVSPYAEISDGVHLLAGCIIQARTRIGAGSIVNTASVVEHDSVLESYVHLAPRSIVCGSARVGSNSHVGAGAVILQGVQLGAETLVGAGAVVSKNFEGGGTLVGVPARQRYGK